MPDILIQFDGTLLQGDLVLANGDLLQGDELVTAIYVSLFTERGSWWANAYEPDQWGSDLLTLRRAHHSNATLLRASDMTKKALAWMIEDNVAQSVDVKTEWQGERLAVAVLITRPRGAVSRYDFVWGGF